jgi:hypothetical protein
MNADCDDHSQQSRNQRQPHFFAPQPELCQAPSRRKAVSQKPGT